MPSVQWTFTTYSSPVSRRTLDPIFHITAGAVELLIQGTGIGPLAREGGDYEAREKLRAGLDLAEPGGWVRNFVDLGAPMRDLLERLNQLRPGHKYTRRVLEACRLEAGHNSSSGQEPEKALVLSEPAPVSILTRRETELLPLLAEGLSYKEIAAKLHVATETVKTHVQNIYGKLHTRGRARAVKEARRLGFIPND